MARTISYGSAIELHAAATSFATPAGDAGGDLTSARRKNAAAPDVLLRFLGADAWAFDKACGVFGQLSDGTWDRIELAIAGGQLLSGLADIGSTFAIAAGGYDRLAIGAYDGTTLTASTAVAVYAIPAYSVEA